VRSSAFWTAVFTAVLTVFTGLLWHVSSQSNESNVAAQQASLASQRAFLSIAFSPRVEVVVEAGKVTGYKVHEGWANNGTTPTQTAIAQYNVASWPDRPTQGFDFAQLPQAERQEYVLGPKAGWEVTSVPLSFDTLASVARGNHIFAWGWVVYRDIFKGTPPRLSEFCFELTNPTWSAADHTNPSALFSASTPPCQTHNCYDEYCADYAKISQEIK